MKILKSVACGSIVAMALPLCSAHADVTNGSAGSTVSTNGDTPVDGDQEIVVTAQRREQSVLTVPLSIQAATGDKLEVSGIHSLTGLQLTIPGYLPNTGSGFTQIFIRGVGNTLFVGADPSVATFVDDVPRIYGSMADDLVDVERVEVLKGAQGGLYGRNATGGVVNIITRTPSTQRAEGDFRVSYGERNTLRASAYGNVPISDSVAVSLSVERDSHDPYVQNIARLNPYTAAMFPAGSNFFGIMARTPQQTADFLNAAVQPSPLQNQDFWALRGKLLIKPADNLSITIAGDYYDKHDNNGQGEVNVTPAQSLIVLRGLFANFGVATAIPDGFLQTPGKFQVAEGAQAVVFTKEYGVSAVAKLSLNVFDITSITAFRHQQSSFAADSSLVDVPTVIDTVQYPYKKYIYQELRAASKFSGPFQMMVGATYLNNKLNGTTNTYFFTQELPYGVTSIRQTVDNWSIYGQASYDFTPALTLTASGRYIEEINNTLFTLPVVSPERSIERKFVPSATLSYKLEDGTVFARWARGFKSGGINLIVAPSVFPTPQDGSIFGPESIDTYEVGYRQGLFDKRVQLTASLFYNDYRNLQVSVRPQDPNSPILIGVLNAKSARTYGAEATLDWRVVDPLRIGITIGYLDAKYRDFTIAHSPIYADVNLNGQQMPNAPKLQLSVNAGLDQPLNARLRLVGNVLVSHTSSVLFMYSAAPGFLPDDFGKGYWLTNARIGVKTADDKWGFAVVADNVFNAGYYTSGDSLALGNSAAWGNPRVVRAEVTAKF